jgi:hypothetical protein
MIQGFPFQAIFTPIPHFLRGTPGKNDPHIRVLAAFMGA